MKEPVIAEKILSVMPTVSWKSNNWIIETVQYVP